MDIKPKNALVMALAPDADRYNGDPTTDWMNMKLLGHGAFIVQEGAGGVGTALLKLQAASDAAGTGAEDLAFAYYVTAAGGGDVFGTRQAAAATGYTTVAGAQKQIVIEFEAAELPAGKPFVALDLTEVANDPVDASVAFIGSEPRYGAEVLPTVLT